jgi:hypothetical protein
VFGFREKKNQSYRFKKRTWINQRAVVPAATPHKAADWMSAGWSRSLGRRNLDAIPAAEDIVSELSQSNTQN